MENMFTLFYYLVQFSTLFMYSFKSSKIKGNCNQDKYLSKKIDVQQQYQI